MGKTPYARTTFGGSDVVKVHAVVAGSTFCSQNGKKTPHGRTTFGRSTIPRHTTPQRQQQQLLLPPLLPATTTATATATALQLQLQLLRQLATTTTTTLQLQQLQLQLLLELLQQLQLQLQQLLLQRQLQHYHDNCNNINYSYSTTTTTLIAIQLQLQLQLNCATLHHTKYSTCASGDHCNHLKKHNSNHLSVHQWIRSAIHASQQLTSPIVSYLWNFRQRLVRYYWYHISTAYPVIYYPCQLYVLQDPMCG